MGNGQAAAIAAVAWMGTDQVPHLVVFGPGSPGAWSEWNATTQQWSSYSALDNENTPCSGLAPFNGAMSSPVAVGGIYNGLTMVDVVLQGSDGNLYRQNMHSSREYWTPEFWNLNSLVDAVGRFQNQPAIVAQLGEAYNPYPAASAARFDVIANANGTLFWIVFDSSFKSNQSGCTDFEDPIAGWVALPALSNGQLIAGSPAATACQPDRIDVIARDATGLLWQSTRIGADGNRHPIPFTPWAPLPALPGGVSVTDTPSVLSLTTGSIDVFARGSDEQAYHISYQASTASWTSWQPLGGSLATLPTAVSGGPGRIDLFARGIDNAVWWSFSADSGASWAPWSSLGARGGSAAFVGAPASASWGPNRLDVFALDAAGMIWHRAGDGTNWAADWEVLNAPQPAAPLLLQVKPRPSAPSLFLAAPNGGPNPVTVQDAGTSDWYSDPYWIPVQQSDGTVALKSTVKSSDQYLLAQGQIAGENVILTPNTNDAHSHWRFIPDFNSDNVFVEASQPPATGIGYTADVHSGSVPTTMQDPAPLWVAQPVRFSKMTAMARLSGESRLFWQGVTGHLYEIEFDGKEWLLGDLSALSGATAPQLPAPNSQFVSLVRNTNEMRVYYQGVNQHIYELVFDANHWKVNDLMVLIPSPGPTVLPQPGTALAAVTWDTEQIHVFAEGTDQHIYEFRFDGRNWYWGDLMTTAPATLPQVGTALTAFVDNQNQIHLFFEGTNRHVFELRWYGQSWILGDLMSSPPSALPQPGSALPGFVAGGQFYLYYESQDQQIHELYFDGYQWRVRDTYALVDSNIKPGTPLVAVPRTGSEIHVYGEQTDGHVFELYFDSISWHYNDITSATVPLEPGTGPGGLAGCVVSNTQNIQVFYEGYNHHLYALVYNGSIWNAQDLSVVVTTILPQVATSLVSFNRDNELRVFFEATNTHTYESSFTGQSWVPYDLMNIPPAILPYNRSAMVGFVRNTNEIRLVFQGTDSHVYEWDFDGVNWSLGDTMSTAPSVYPQLGTPLTGFPRNTGEMRFYYVGTDQNLYELKFDSSGWSVGTQLPGSPAATTKLTSFTRNGSEIHVYFVGTDNNIHELHFTGDSWVLGTLSGIPQAGTALLGFVQNTVEIHLYFQGTDQNLYELHFDGNQTWYLGSLSGTPQAGTPLAGYTRNGSEIHVFFVGTDRHIYELYFDSIHWHTNDIWSAASATALAASSTNLTAALDAQNQMHVYYQGADQNLYELYFGGNGWHAGVLPMGT